MTEITALIVARAHQVANDMSSWGVAQLGVKDHPLSVSN